MYLLDTNVVSDFIHNPRGMVARRIAAVGETSVATSIVVASELRFVPHAEEHCPDWLIAAHTLSLGATLVTANVREFERVEGLTVENWLRPA